MEAEYNRLGTLDPMDDPFAAHQDEHDQHDGAFVFPSEDPLPDNEEEEVEPTPQEHTTGGSDSVPGTVPPRNAAPTDASDTDGHDSSTGRIRVNGALLHPSHSYGFYRGV